MLSIRKVLVFRQQHIDDDDDDVDGEPCCCAFDLSIVMCAAVIYDSDDRFDVVVTINYTNALINVCQRNCS